MCLMLIRWAGFLLHITSIQLIGLLRYFYEELPDLHVISAGSLLEFAMKKVKSFPVGRVEYLYLHRKQLHHW